MANYISSGGISDSSMMIMDEGNMGAEGAKGEVFALCGNNNSVQEASRRSKRFSHLTKVRM